LSQALETIGADASSANPTISQTSEGTAEEQNPHTPSADATDVTSKYNHIQSYVWMSIILLQSFADSDWRDL